MAKELNSEGTAEVYVFEMTPPVLFDRVAKGWLNVQILRSPSYPSGTKKTAREYFFKEYGLEKDFTGKEEEHTQYKKDKEIIKEVFWETTKNVLEDISQRILTQWNELVSIKQNDDELVLLDGFLNDWHEASMELAMLNTNENDNTYSQVAIDRQKEHVLKQLNFNSLKDLQTAYSKRLPIFTIIISQFKDPLIWFEYFQQVDLDKRLIELSKLVSESTEFLLQAANDLIEKKLQGEKGNWVEYQNILKLVSFLIFPKNNWRDNSLKDLCFDLYKSTIGDWELYYKPMLKFALSVAGIVAMLLHGDIPGAAFIIGLLSFSGEIGIAISEIISRSELGDLQKAQEFEIIETVVANETAGDMTKTLVISLAAGVILSGIAARLGRLTQTGKISKLVHEYNIKPQKVLPDPKPNIVTPEKKLPIQPKSSAKLPEESFEGIQEEIPLSDEVRFIDPSKKRGGAISDHSRGISSVNFTVANPNEPALVKGLNRLKELTKIDFRSDRILEAPWTRGRSCNVTSEGFLRDLNKFKKVYSETWPNDEIVKNGFIVTDELANKFKWPLGDVLVHHHIDNSAFVTFIPDKIHRLFHGLIHIL